MSHRRKSPSSSERSANGSKKEKRNATPEISQAENNELYHMVGNVTKENLEIKFKTYNEDELATLHRYIANKKGLADRLFKARWITKKQKDDINFVATTLGYGGKRRYSTRSKKYKKSNKRSKRTRTLRRKRYSRKS